MSDIEISADKLCVFVPLCSEWYLNGNYLVIFVSVAVILPLALMKQLGERDNLLCFSLGNVLDNVLFYLC